jgi:hypothetical protein
VSLKLVHQILICAAIIFGLILIVFAAMKGDRSHLASGVVGALLSIGGGLYLRWFLKKQTK